MNEPKNENKKFEEQSEKESVTGSGYSYDEPTEPTDRSIPLEKAEGADIVELPDLGEQTDRK